MRALGVIPARGNSKRVPRKNLRQLCGRPLIQYTIEAASAATKLTTFVVSTEDYEIGHVAANLGAYVVRRPDDLSGDDVTTGAVLKHALEYMETEAAPSYDMVVCLHPTSPIRKDGDIDLAIELLWHSSLNSLASVCPLPIKTHPNIGTLVGGSFIGSSWPHYILNASIYAVRRDWLMVHGKHVADGGTSVLPLIMDRRHSLDIDDEIDLKVAELFLNDAN